MADNRMPRCVDSCTGPVPWGKYGCGNGLAIGEQFVWRTRRAGPEGGLPWVPPPGGMQTQPVKPSHDLVYLVLGMAWVRAPVMS